MKNGKNYQNKPKRRAITLIALTFSAIALLSVIWIVFPAPAYGIWLFSVLASEWSLAFGLLALFGIFISFFTKSRLRIVTFLTGFSAFIISLCPLASAYQAIGENPVSLSLTEYVSGFSTRNPPQKFITKTFAQVDGSELKADIYSPPENVNSNKTAIIVVHGGSWNAGERSDFPLWNDWLARQGFTVFDIDYRLAPQPNWQTAIGDVKCAAGWVQQNAAEFSIDADKVALMGRSAGGQLALTAAYTSDSPEFPASCATAPIHRVLAVVSFYAPTDLIWSFDNPANPRVIDGPATLSRFLGGNPRDSEETKKKYLVSSPTNNVSSQTPPTLLIHGGHDQLVRFQNTNFLDEKLKENEVPHEKIFISYAQHGFDYNFHGWGAQIVKPRVLKFIAENTK